MSNDTHLEPRVSQSVGFDAWTLDAGSFIGSNDAFGRKNLPQVRLAILTCNRDESELAKAVLKLAADPELIPNLIAQWRQTADYFAEITNALETALARISLVTEEIGIGSVFNKGAANSSASQEPPSPSSLIQIGPSSKRTGRRHGTS